MAGKKKKLQAEELKPTVAVFEPEASHEDMPDSNEFLDMPENKVEHYSHHKKFDKFNKRETK